MALPRAYKVQTKFEKETPETYKDAVMCKEKSKWRIAMEKEMGVFKKYNAYTLVSPDYVKSVTGKTIFIINGVW